MDDSQVESDEESFSISLSNPQPADCVTISPDLTTITIFDDDEEISKKLTPLSYPITSSLNSPGFSSLTTLFYTVIAAIAIFFNLQTLSCQLVALVETKNKLQHIK